jgi:cytochrome c oxidase accessory protein FixG
MDENSLVVAYDAKRGEPRRNRGVVEPSDEGDCIDCMHCVRVCPTGIDIRRGTQLECIACTMCIDACDEIMDKLDRPPGLIRYDSERGLEGKPRKLIRPRPIIYTILILALGAAFLYVLNQRNNLKVQFIRGSKSPFQTIEREAGTKEIVNHYKVSLYYQGEKDLKLFFQTNPPFHFEKLRVVTRKVPHPITKGSKQTVDLFFRFQKDVLEMGRRTIKVQILSGETLDKAKLLREEEVKLVGPF